MSHYYYCNENTEFQKGARHQAQCSGTNWVEKLALPQCIFHRACFKTKSLIERSTAWCSKETAEFSEKKRLHEIGFGIKHCRSHCCCPPDPFTSAGALSLGHWVWLFLQVTLGTANLYPLKCPLEHSIFLLSISLNKNAYQQLAHKESLPFFHKLKKYILGCPLKSLLLQISEFSSWWMFPNPYGCWWWELKLLTTQKVDFLPQRL